MRRLKMKPWARKLAPVELWPEAPKGPRPLRPGEQIAEGQAVYIEGQGAAYTFRDWLWCGRTRYALLDSGAGYLHVVIDSQVRL